MGRDSTQPARSWRGLYRRIDFRIPDSKRNAIYESVLSSSHLDPEYLMLLGLAALIALFGLLQNSAAVIIGAMLISPLMNPILSAALALLLGDGNLGRKSALVLLLSVVGAIAITWLVASLSPLKQSTPEILARTSPNLLDLFIAFLSGLAGTLALRAESGSLTILPGVAIAVAVIPPLAVAGYGLSTRQGAIAGGAFLLFITNLVSIIISAALVFRLMGFRPHKETEEGHLKLKYRMAISTALLIVLSVPLFQTLRNAVIQIGLRSEIARELAAAFAAENSSVSDLTFSKSRGGLLVRTTLRTTRYFDAAKVDAAQEALRKRFGPETKLQIDQILVAQGGITAAQAARMQNAISGGVVRPVTLEPPFDIKASSNQMIAHIQKRVDEALAGTPIHLAGEVRAELGSNPPLVLRLRLACQEPLDKQVIALLASQLSSKISSPVELHGQVEIQGPVYGLVLEALNLHRTLRPADRRALDKLVNAVRANSRLRLQVNYTTRIGNGGGERMPLLVREIGSILSRSRLAPSQWSIQRATEIGSDSRTTAGVTRPTEQLASSKIPGPSALAEVRCELKTYQDF